MWQVVGGENTGIMVRKGKDLKSVAEEERLKKGSIIEEVVLDGQRLQYKMVVGSGPEEGWVSLSLKGKDLVVPEGSIGHAKKFPQMFFNTPVPKQTYKEFIEEHNKSRMAADSPLGPLESYAQGLMEGRVRAGATGRQPTNPDDPVDADFEKRRELVANNVPKVIEELEKYKHPPGMIRKTKKELEAEAPAMLPGDSYGLDVPPNLDALEKLGAPWLTKAFRAAGTIAADNSVTKIVVFKRLPVTTKDSAGGAGAKAFLTLEYEKPDPELHTELFVKLPWDTVGDKDTGGCAMYRFKLSSGMSGDMEYQECTIYHFLGHILPFQTPKFYFADICRSNTNYILITEKILFGGSADYFGGKHKKTFEKYEVLPVAEKYFDFERPPKQRYEMYYAIMRAMARMAAWDHNKHFDFLPKEITGANRYPMPCLGMFEFPMKQKPQKRAMGAKIAATCFKSMKELVREKGKRCFPLELRNDDFFKALEAGMADAAVYKDDIAMYGLLFPEMISFTHVNCQSDNAYFWYNSTDEIDCGIIDWGGAGPMPLVNMFQGALTSCEGDVLAEHEVGFIRCYIETFHGECGIKLNLGEIHRLFQMYQLVSANGYCINIEQDIFVEVPRERWGNIDSIENPLIIENWNTRCYTYMIRSNLRYLYCHWKKNGQRLTPHKALQDWLEYWKSKGLE